MHSYLRVRIETPMRADAARRARRHHTRQLFVGASALQIKERVRIPTSGGIKSLSWRKWVYDAYAQRHRGAEASYDAALCGSFDLSPGNVTIESNDQNQETIHNRYHTAGEARRVRELPISEQSALTN